MCKVQIVVFLILKFSIFIYYILYYMNRKGWEKDGGFQVGEWFSTPHVRRRFCKWEKYTKGRDKVFHIIRHCNMLPPKPLIYIFASPRALLYSTLTSYTIHVKPKINTYIYKLVLIRIFVFLYLLLSHWPILHSPHSFYHLSFHIKTGLCTNAFSTSGYIYMKKIFVCHPFLSS